MVSISSPCTAEVSSGRRHYTLEYKAKVIRYFDALKADPNLPINEKSLNHMSKLTQVDRRILKNWMDSKERILEAPFKRKLFKLPSLIDQCICTSMENKVFDWVKANRRNGCCISGDAIQKEAILAYNIIHPEVITEEFASQCNRDRVSFSASRGWLNNFCARKNLVLRRVTTSGRDLPVNVHDIIFDFFKDVSI